MAEQRLPRLPPSSHALLAAGQPRLVYEPEADFYGADEITVEVTTDVDENASTVIPIVVAPLDDAATLLVTGSATAEAGGAQVCVLDNATVADVAAEYCG